MTIAKDQRQRRIEIADEAPAAGKAAFGDLAHMIQHAMDIDRSAIERALIGEHLHAVDESDNAIDFLADETGKVAASLVQTRLQKLCCTAHA